eukprot:tig00000478_g1260.t1
MQWAQGATFGCSSSFVVFGESPINCTITSDAGGLLAGDLGNTTFTPSTASDLTSLVASLENSTTWPTTPATRIVFYNVTVNFTVPQNCSMTVLNNVSISALDPLSVSPPSISSPVQSSTSVSRNMNGHVTIKVSVDFWATWIALILAKIALEAGRTYSCVANQTVGGVTSIDSGSVTFTTALSAPNITSPLAGATGVKRADGNVTLTLAVDDGAGAASVRCTRTDTLSAVETSAAIAPSGGQADVSIALEAGRVYSCVANQTVGSVTSRDSAAVEFATELLPPNITSPLAGATGVPRAGGNVTLTLAVDAEASAASVLCTRTDTLESATTAAAIAPSGGLANVSIALEAGRAYSCVANQSVGTVTSSDSELVAFTTEVGAPAIVDPLAGATGVERVGGNVTLTLEVENGATEASVRCTRSDTLLPVTTSAAITPASNRAMVSIALEAGRTYSCVANQTVGGVTSIDSGSRADGNVTLTLAVDDGAGAASVRCTRTDTLSAVETSAAIAPSGGQADVSIALEAGRVYSCVANQTVGSVTSRDSAAVEFATELLPPNITSPLAGRRETDTLESATTAAAIAPSGGLANVSIALEAGRAYSCVANQSVGTVTSSDSELVAFTTEVGAPAIVDPLAGATGVERVDGNVTLTLEVENGATEASVRCTRSDTLLPVTTSAAITPASNRAMVSIALEAGRTYSCVANQTVGGVTSIDSGSVTFTTALSAPNITSPLAGATGVKRADGNVTLTLAVDDGAGAASVRCTRTDTLSAVETSAAIAPSGGQADVSIALEAGRVYSCVANQTVGSVTSRDSAAVEFATELLPPNITSPLAGATGVPRAGGNVTLTLAVDAEASAASVLCTRTDTLESATTAAAIAPSGGLANVSIALEAGRAYSCVANQSVGTVTSSDSELVAFTTEVGAPAIVDPLAGATGVERVGGNVTLTLEVENGATEASVRCTRSDTLLPVTTSAAITPASNRAMVSIALEAGRTYSCVANQTVGGVTSIDSGSRADGNVTLTLAVDDGAGAASVRCTRTDTLSAVETSAAIAPSGGQADVSIALEAGRVYSCVANQTVGSVTSRDSAAVEFATELLPPNITSPLAGATGVPRAGGNVTLTLAVDAEASAASVLCTRTDTLESDTTAAAIAPSGGLANVSIALEAGRAYSCVANQSVGTVTSSDSELVAFTTEVGAPAIVDPLAGATGVERVDGNVTLTLEVENGATEASVRCTRSDTLLPETTSAAITPASNRAMVSIALEAGRTYSCVANQTVGGVTSIDSGSVTFTTALSAPNITSPLAGATGVKRADGNVTLTLAVDDGAGAASVRCTRTDTLSAVETSAAIAPSSGQADVSIALEAGRVYSCVANQTVGSATSRDSAAVEFATELLPPNITSPLAGATGVPRAGGNVTLTLAVDAEASAASVLCTRTDTLESATTAAAIAPSGGLANVSIALEAGRAYSCVANQSVGTVTSSDSELVAFTTEVGAPAIVDPLAGATGVERVDGNVTLTLEVENGATEASVRCTRSDTLLPETTSAAITPASNRAMVSIALEAGRTYSCVANQTVGGVTSIDSGSVTFTTALSAPNITSPLAGATGVKRADGNVTLTLAVDDGAGAASVRCTRTDTLSAVETSAAIAPSGDQADVSIALEAGRVYSCVANQTVGSVTSRDSAAVEFATELLPPNITSPLAGATGVPRAGGNVTLTLAVDAEASAASVLCTRTDTLESATTAAAIAPSGGLANVSIALEAGRAYSCVANQSVGTVTSSDSELVAFTTEVGAPAIVDPLAGATGVERVGGNVTLTLEVENGATEASVRCTRSDTLLPVTTSAAITPASNRAMVSIALEAGRTYSCVANQTVGGVTSIDSGSVTFTTALSAPNITSPLAGATGVKRADGNVTLTLAVDDGAGAASVRCTRTDTLSAVETSSVAIAPSGDQADVSIALEAGRVYSCVANQTVGSVTSRDSAAVEFATELLPPNITSPLAGATGVPRAGGNVTLTLAVDAEASAASVLCTRTDTLESATTAAAIAPSGGLANVSIALEAGRAYSCRVDGNVTLTLEVENGATEASVRCTRSDTLLPETTSAAITPASNRAMVSIALEAGRTYSCVANQTVGGVTSIDSGSVTFTTALSAPNITSPLAGATGVKRADGNVTLTLAVDDGAGAASVRCTRTDTLSAVETSAAIAPSGGQADVSIALEAGRVYSECCVRPLHKNGHAGIGYDGCGNRPSGGLANVSRGTVTSSDSELVAFTTEVGAPAIVDPLAGATGVERVDGNVTLTLEVENGATEASVRCTRSDTLLPETTSAAITPASNRAMVSIALEAGRTYSCVANQTVGGVTSIDSGAVTFTTALSAPNITSPLAGATGVKRADGNVTLTLAVDDGAGAASVRCTRTDTLATVETSSAIIPSDGQANVSIALEAGRVYSCVANQTVGSVTSRDSSALEFTTELLPPVITLISFSDFGNGVAIVDLEVDLFVENVSVICMATDGSIQVTITSTFADGSTETSVEVPLDAGRKYICEANQTNIFFESSPNSVSITFTTALEPPSIISPLTGGTDVERVDGNVTLTLEVENAATEASVRCTRSDTLLPVTTSAAITPASNRATVSIALDAGRTYSCVANQTVGGVTSIDSGSVTFTTALSAPNITSPLAGATGVPRVDGNVTLTLAVDQAASATSVRCTRTDTLSAEETSAAIAPSGGQADVSIALEAGRAYSCVANQTAGSVTSSDSAEVEFTTELLPPNITSPLAGATGVPRAGGNVTLTLAVDAAASSVSLMCTRSDTLSATETSVAIAGNSNHATVSIALEAGRTYSCVANQTVGSVTSSDSAAVAFTTELLAPNITSPLAGATGVAREGGNVTLTLAVDAAASAASIHCTRTDSLSTVETSSAIVPNDGLAAVSIALDAGSTYSCVANQTVGSVTSSDSAVVAFTTELLPPNITSPLAGATGVPRVDGNVTLFVAVDAGSSVVSARCTRLDTLTSVAGSAPIALGTGSTMVSIAVEAGWAYSCVANQTAGSVTSSDSAEVEFTTELLPPNITSPLAGAMGVGREGGNVTLTLAVDAAASAVSLMCTRSDTLSATETSVAITGNSNHATVSIALEAGRTYSCVANQTVGSVTSSDSAAVAFTTELLAPNITSPLAGATGVAREGGNVTLTLAVDAAASAASIHCTRTDSLSTVETSSAIVPNDGLAAVSIALDAGSTYSCVANQTVGSVTSSDSAVVAFTTELLPPNITSPLAGATGVPRVDGNVTLFVAVDAGSSVVSARCTRLDTLTSVAGSAPIALGTGSTMVSIAVEAGWAYSCVANQTAGSVTSSDSAEVEFTTELLPPNITSPLAGAMGVGREGGNVTLTLAVDAAASAVSLMCTRSDTLSATETSVAITGNSNHATVSIALEAGRTYSCVANQTVGSVTSSDSAAVAFTTELLAPNITSPLAGATGVAREGGNVTLTLAVDAAASAASIHCTRTDSLSTVETSSAIVPNDGLAAVSIALDAGSTYSCVANQTVGSVTSSDSAAVAFTTELLPPNITSPLAGATGVPRVDGNVTLFVAVDAGSSVVSARCTRLDTLTSVSGGAPIALGTGSTMVSIAVEAGRTYSCVANQTAGSVTSSDSAEVEFTTELLPPNITSPLAGATGVGREGGNVTLTLAVDAAASSVSLMCTRSDTLSATATSVAIAGNSNHATVSIALEAGRTYSCVANQTVGSVTSSDSAAVAFTTELLAPNITSPLAGRRAWRAKVAT